LMVVIISVSTVPFPLQVRQQRFWFSRVISSACFKSVVGLLRVYDYTYFHVGCFDS
jgi:hypothetical protein